MSVKHPGQFNALRSSAWRDAIVLVPAKYTMSLGAMMFVGQTAGKSTVAEQTEHSRVNLFHEAR